jgi:hypothetical protein
MEAPIPAVATVAVPRWPARRKAGVMVTRASAEAVAETQWGKVGPLSHPPHHQQLRLTCHFITFIMPPPAKFTRITLCWRMRGCWQ